MQIFLSWSGERSKQVALLLKEWIASVIQIAKPWVSDKDIDRGAQWFTEIAKVLSDCKIGIVCLTEENKNSPWILFESGALVKGLPENRLCTFLIDLKPTDIHPPLSQFNHSEPTKESLFKLVKTINDSAGDNKLSDSVLSKVFETFFPVFEKDFNQILEKTPSSKQKQTKNQTEVLEEVLLTVRNLEKESYVKDNKMLDMLKEFIAHQTAMSNINFSRFNRTVEENISKSLNKDTSSGMSALDKIRKKYFQENSAEEPPLDNNINDEELPF